MPLFTNGPRSWRIWSASLTPCQEAGGDTAREDHPSTDKLIAKADKLMIKRHEQGYEHRA